jgi:hypothetical protein
MGIVHIGIDPGTTGAVCVLTPAPAWGSDVRDLPVIVEPKMRKGKLGKARKVDAAKLVAMLREMVPAGHSVLVTIEDVFTISGLNTSSLSSDAMVAARVTCENACAMLGWKVQKVRPQTWQNFFGLKGADKKLSLGTAQRLYPAVGLKLAKEHNKAEAVLIAHYARRNHTEALG